MSTSKEINSISSAQDEYSLPSETDNEGPDSICEVVFSVGGEESTGFPGELTTAVILSRDENGGGREVGEYNGGKSSLG